MNPGTIFIGLALLFVAALFVSNPLLNTNKFKKGNIAQEIHKVSAETEYKAALKALSDLDFDFQSGRVTQEDYTNLRVQLMTEASKYVQSPLEINQSEADDVIEKLIRDRKATLRNTSTCKKCGHVLHQGDRFCPGCGEGVQASCPKCGKEVSGEDEFCSSCGTRLTSAGYKLEKKGSIA